MHESLVPPPSLRGLTVKEIDEFRTEFDVTNVLEKSGHEVKALGQKAEADLEGVELRSNRFGIEPELTARFARMRARIYEVPVSYHGRTYAEGKKIGWRDGFAALWAIVRFNLFG